MNEAKMKEERKQGRHERRKKERKQGKEVGKHWREKVSQEG